MGSAPALPQTAMRFTLTVTSGPDAGATFQLLPPKVTIGRDPENHIALKDPRCSRHQATIEFGSQKIVIKDMSGRGNMLVNSQSTNEQPLKSGDRIQLGETEIVFRMEMPMMKTGQQNPLAMANPGAVPATPFPPGQGVRMGPPPNERSRAMSDEEKNKKKRFYLIVAIVIGAFGYIMMSESEKAKSREGLRTVDQVEKEIQTVEERTEVARKKRTFANEEERTRYQEAQKHYLEGFRDFQKGQFARAMKSFETSRAIDPSHEMAGRYFVLAEKQRDEMVALLMLEARRYREKNSFKRCSAALEKVLDALSNKQDLKYKESETLKRECDLNWKEDGYEN